LAAELFLAADFFATWLLLPKVNLFLSIVQKFQTTSPFLHGVMGSFFQRLTTEVNQFQLGTLVKRFN
jgi:hypothetical protein